MLPMNEAPLEAAQLLVDPYVLLVPADSPLAGRGKPPSLREIAKEPLIGYRQCRSMAAVETAIRRAGAEPRIVFRSDDNGTVQGLVGAGIGVALVPRLTLQPTEGASRWSSWRTCCRRASSGSRGTATATALPPRARSSRRRRSSAPSDALELVAA